MRSINANFDIRSHITHHTSLNREYQVQITQMDIGSSKLLRDFTHYFIILDEKLEYRTFFSLLKYLS